jgi:hypothetical protein
MQHRKQFLESPHERERSQCKPNHYSPSPKELLSDTSLIIIHQHACADTASSPSRPFRAAMPPGRETHNDITISPHIDHYYNLTGKVIQALDWYLLHEPCTFFVRDTLCLETHSRKRHF